MQFFVPIVPGFPDDEGAYGQLAAFCEVPVPPPGKRVYSITFRHNGEDWSATVGKVLRGEETKTVRRRGRGTVERTTSLRDLATVIAIFNGDPALVVTDAPPFGPTVSAWVNPFMAGLPWRVEYFTE